MNMDIKSKVAHSSCRSIQLMAVSSRYMIPVCVEVGTGSALDSGLIKKSANVMNTETTTSIFTGGKLIDRLPLM